MLAQRWVKSKWLIVAGLASLFLVLLGQHLLRLQASHDVLGYGYGSTDDSRHVSYNGSELAEDGDIILAPVPWKYTSALVIARTKSQSVPWPDEEKLEMDQFIYVADDPTAPLHPPANKGNEAMVYLTYIIDHYDSLRDITVFMHAHRFSGHNNVFLNEDSAMMLQHLNPERVMRDGYMNLRCQSDPGCPAMLHPAQGENGSHNLDPLMAKVWPELFPGEPIPEEQGQACCAQFAVTRERILATPLSKYQHYRNWLLEADLIDYVSGRVFEYMWQVLFAGQSVFCPDQLVCYCDGYGVCFEKPEDIDEWFSLRDQRYRADVRMVLLEDIKAEHEGASGDLLDRIESCQKTLGVERDEYEARMNKIRNTALRRGQNPKVRAAAVSGFRTKAPSSRKIW